jgi:RHS repeat-associated protein
MKWLVGDHLGTPRMVIDQSGDLTGANQVIRHDYLPFGEEIQVNTGIRTTSNGYAGDGIRQKFTGKDRDSETGLDYFEARYFASKQGRFTSPDEFSGGPDDLFDFADVASENPTLYGELTEPQSLNKYVYCYNNPLSFIDIDGHKTWGEWLKTGLEVASYIPGPIGAGASLVQAGIAVAQGDYKGALVAAAGAVPGGKLLATGAKVLNTVAKGGKVIDKLGDAANATKSLNRAAGPCGLCFAEGTKVNTPEGQVNIEQLRVGDKVRSTLLDYTKTDGWTAVNAATWRLIKLRMPNPGDSSDVYEMELLRPLDWITKTGAVKGGALEVEFPEMNLRGRAEVVGILACPKIKPGPGRVVLSTLTHRSPQLMEIKIEGQEQILEPTVTHPFFSEDRRDWVQAGELRVGEMVRTKECPARIAEIKWKPGTHRVYNIEVEADHTYFVAKLGILVHNTCGKVVPNPHGKLGGPAHQKKVADVETDIKNRGLEPKKEEAVQTTGGFKDRRYVDVVAKDGSGNIVEYHQVGRQTKKGLPVKREREAASDISKATKKPVIFHPIP